MIMNTHGDETAKVILARKPDADLVETIVAFTQSRWCTKVKYTIDPKIVGGIIIYIGDVIYDGSVRSRLENIKHSL